MAARNGHVKVIEYLIKEHGPTLIDATVQVCILLYLIICCTIKYDYICRMVGSQFTLPVLKGM